MQSETKNSKLRIFLQKSLPRMIFDRIILDLYTHYLHKNAKGHKVISLLSEILRKTVVQEPLKSHQITKKGKSLCTLSSNCRSKTLSNVPYMSCKCNSIILALKYILVFIHHMNVLNL